MGHYNWAPVYVPAPSLSPKLYSLVRNIRMTSIDRESTMRQTESHDLEDDLDNDVFASDKKTAEKVRKSPSKSNFDRLHLLQASSHPSALPPVISTIDSEANRNCETARRFYASMRHTTLGQTNSSVESSTTDPPLVSPTRSTHATRNEKLKFFRTPGFFYSITNKK